MFQIWDMNEFVNTSFLKQSSYVVTEAGWYRWSYFIEAAYLKWLDEE